MNDVSAHSNREMTYWQAWFHFWVKSFPGAIHTKDHLNPSFYYTESKRKLRVFIHFVVLIILAIALGTFLSPVTGVTGANAQNMPCNSYGYCPPSPSGGGGNGNSNGYNPAPNPNGGGSHGTQMGSSQIDQCAAILDEYRGEYQHLASQGYARMAECYAQYYSGDRGWWPDTSCEWASIAGMTGSGMAIGAGVGGSIPSGGWSNLATYGGFISFSASYMTYLGCDGRW